MYFAERLKGLSSKNLLISLFLFLVLVTTIRFSILGFDPTKFMVHGERFSVEGGEVDIAIVDEGGYDGQYFGRIAFDPFDIKQESLGVKLDRPAYRYQRILYPFLSWALAFGHSPLVPYTLILVNILSLTVLGFLLFKLSENLTLNRIFLIFVPLTPGLIMALGRDLSEPLAAALLVGALLSFLNSKYVLYVLLAALCVLCRETTLVFFGAIGLAYTFFRGKKPGPEILLFLIPLFTYGVWQWILLKLFGETGFSASPKNFGIPFAGMASYLFEILPSMSKKEVVLQAVYSLWLAILAFYSVKTLKVRSHDIFLQVLSISWILWAGIAVCFSALIWEDDWSYCRVLIDWIICSYLLILLKTQKLPHILTLVSLMVCAGTILRIMVKV